MKAMYKCELARAAGVSTTTFKRWITKHEEELKRLGNEPKAKIINPAGVEYLCRIFVIEV
jgi:transposase-like protein